MLPHCRIVTACTGEKALTEAPLTAAELMAAVGRWPARARALPRLPAEALYTGMQHVRLRQGLDAYRTRGRADCAIVSAGFGLVDGDTPLPAYECTFAGMGTRARRTWADRLGLPDRLRTWLAAPGDLRIVCLGAEYLDACRWDAAMPVGGPTILLVGAKLADRLRGPRDLTILPLGLADATRFHCGMVGLKGEVARRLLVHLATARAPLPLGRPAELLRLAAAVPAPGRPPGARR